MTRRVPELYKAVPDALCYIHPDDAKARGLRRGDEVLIANKRGEVRARVEHVDATARHKAWCSYRSLMLAF